MSVNTMHLLSVAIPKCANKGYIPPESNKETNKDDPWIPEIVPNDKDIIIAGLTPVGTIARVPTTSNRPIRSISTVRLSRSHSLPDFRIYEKPRAKTHLPRVKLTIVQPNKITPTINPIFKANIYLRTG